MNNTNQTVTLNTRWTRNVEALTFSATSVRVVFKDGPTYEGDLDGLKAHIKEHKVHFQDSTVAGAKVGIFYTFKPSNQRQRDWLAGKLGRKVEVNECYTFATRHMAAQAWVELEAADIPSNDSNWPLGFIEHSQQPSEAANSPV